ncbi:Choline transport protein [Vanrija pseudolonga]|uniref:Choline transport protein n=1 Tax=Vanrija pseudolonga TaxID=143232 RepID=A0AAF1BJ32_9TREE|nr:Choline transport protein [Vanrija pseudolonga]
MASSDEHLHADVHDEKAADAAKATARHTARVHSVVENEVHLERNFSFLASLGLAFTLLNSWTGGLSLVLPSGGSVSMVWGLLVSAVGTMLMCVSLAEICHFLPLSGGQYDWAYILAPESNRNSLAFFTGWMATAGWVALAATAAALGSTFVTGIISLWHPSYSAQAWQGFLIYIGILLQSFVLNIFSVRLLPHIDKFAGLWSMVGIVTVIIVCLVCSRGDYQPAKAVFAQWTNETGWPNGMAFIMGLLQSVFGLTGFDAATHMIEEMPAPKKNAPQVMVSAVIMGTVTSWLFMIVLLFCLTSFDDVLNSGATTGPLLTIYYQATRSRVGATCLIMFNLMAFVFVQQVLITVSSRMLLTLARDRGVGQLSRFLAPVHPTLKVPVWSIIFCTFWVVVFGLINLGSAVALNAILSSSVVLLQISYFVPILLACLRGEKAFQGYDRDARWNLGRWRRPINALALVFLAVTTICFMFPPIIPVNSGSEMNWVVLVVGIVFIMCGVTWLVDGRKRFQGPSELEERLAESLAS